MILRLPDLLVRIGPGFISTKFLQSRIGEPAGDRLVVLDAVTDTGALALRVHRRNTHSLGGERSTSGARGATR